MFSKRSGSAASDLLVVQDLAVFIPLVTRNTSLNLCRHLIRPLDYAFNQRPNLEVWQPS